MDWEKYSWVMRSDQRQEILRLLENPKTPSQLSDELDAHIAQVSYSVGKFQDQGIVELINKEAEKGKLYRLTDTGEELLEELRKD